MMDQHARAEVLRRSAILVIFLFLAGFSIPLGLGTVEASTLCVNPGGTGGCFSSIQAAINTADPGDTISVAAGTYAEQVTITEPITLQGVGGVDSTGSPAPSQTIIRPTSLPNTAGSLFSGSPLAYIILADMTKGVAIKDLTVDGGSAAFTSCSPGYVGIFMRASSGTIENVYVQNVRLQSGHDGCQSVLGIFVQSGNGGPELNSSVSMSNLIVENYGKNGITCNEAGTSCTVSDSKVKGRGVTYYGDAAQNGIQIGFGARGLVVGNTVQDNFYDPNTWIACGLLFFEGGGGIGRAKGNTFSNNEQDICTAGVGPRDQ